MNNKELGKIGEERAAEYLIKSGYTIVERNFKCKAGEIDIIASKEKTLAFVEVKTRSSLNHGYPSESVTYRKRKHIACAANYYIKYYFPNSLEYRFDVIEILNIDNEMYCHHICDAFEEGGVL